MPVGGDDGEKLRSEKWTKFRTGPAADGLSALPGLLHGMSEDRNDDERWAVNICGTGVRRKIALEWARRYIPRMDGG